MPTVKRPRSPEEADRAIQGGQWVSLNPCVVSPIRSCVSWPDLLSMGLPDSTVVLVVAKGWRRWRTQGDLAKLFGEEYSCVKD